MELQDAVYWVEHLIVNNCTLQKHFVKMGDKRHNKQVVGLSFLLKSEKFMMMG